MKIIRVSFRFLFCACALLCAVEKASSRPYIYFLDEESQRNVRFNVCDFKHPAPCTPKTINHISNNNLFSPAEQKMLNAIAIKYKNVTTNVGPAGSVLTQLDKATFEGDNWQGILAHFTYPNSGAQDDIFFEKRGIVIAKYQSTPGNGYYAEVGKDALVIEELRNGALNGLFASFLDNRLITSFHFTNDKVLGKFYIWLPIDLVSKTDGVAVDAEFKEPYDLFKHSLMGNEDTLRKIDRPKSITTLWQKESLKP